MAGSGTAHLRPIEERFLDVRNLIVQYRGAHGQKVHAVSDVSFDIRENETVGLVGESGCGKSTIGRALMQLTRATSGSVSLQGVDLSGLSRAQLRRTRTQMQMIFQDPISSLNPRRKVKHIVSEGLSIWRRLPLDSYGRSSDRILESVGLDPELVRDRRPHQFSGGQCQRISIARALALEPRLLICDEPVSALDVSIQAQILNLLSDVKRRLGLSMLFISHDLAVVRNISDRVIVMYMGKICEVGDVDAIFSRPSHHYTSILLSSIPKPDPRHRPEPLTMLGDTPSPIDPPSGCRFRTRCSAADSRCATEEPTLQAIGPGHFVACHHPVAWVTPPTSPLDVSASLESTPESTSESTW